MFATAENVGEVVHGQPAWWLVALFFIQCLFIGILAKKRYWVMKGRKIVPAFSELQELSTFLLSGAIIAQIWVHGDPASYEATMRSSIAYIGNIDISLHFVVNEIFMVFFFGVAVKELTEATLKEGGALRGKRGILPMAGCIGGVIGPVLVFLLLCSPEQRGAWAVPCATDIAFAWLGARVIWGEKHPAVIFLVALAIADDFVGMAIIAMWYPQHAFNPAGLALIFVGAVMAYCMSKSSTRKMIFQKWWVYLCPGLLCWIGLMTAGLHAALALAFVVPFMPREGRDKGLFEGGYTNNNNHHDSLNQFEKSIKPGVDVGLFFFGLCNAGVAWASDGSGWNQDSTAVFLGLGIGKTVGIVMFTSAGWLILRLLDPNAKLPHSPETGQHMAWRDLPLVGVLGAMGFTVALFVAEAAGGHHALKLGALASFAYLGIAVLPVYLKRIFSKKKIREK